MILGRHYAPEEGELMYHYCSADAFLQIITSRTIWLTAHHSLNDTMERTWGYLKFKEAFNQLGTVEKVFSDTVLKMVDLSQQHSLLMISSFSLDPDLLSQWRAYADDGRGFAIGFSPQLMHFPAAYLRVLYDEKEQIAELLGNLKHVYQYERSLGFKCGEEFQSHWFHFGLALCAYKAPGFGEEKEIRLAQIAGLIPDGKSQRIVPLGARDQDGNRTAAPGTIQFRTSKGLIIPYTAVKYCAEGATNPVRDVVLGPRNENDEHGVDIFLRTVGIADVTVRRSSVSYR